MQRTGDDGAEIMAARARARVGLAMFALYVALYAGFMALVLLRPEWLSKRPFGGTNLAIAYGLGLIAAAIVLAGLYMAACRLVERRGR
ncbi:MAG: DUF485 domain-containing protein [Planctomycetia bacterium]|jgi:uncharacterized membrane protein (DUF485 family)